MYPFLLKNIIRPVLQLRKPPEMWIVSRLKLLEKSQWWTSSQLEQYQRKKLRALIVYAYDNVPYYHKKFRELGLNPGEIKGTKDLLKLPILTKDEIRNNLQDMVAKNYQHAIPHYTGGSTGEPLKFYKDKLGGSWGGAVVYRAWEWAGFNMGDKHVLLWGHFRDLESRKKLATRLMNRFLRQKMLSCFDITEKSLEEYIQIIRQFKPKVIRGYVSPVYLLAKYMKHNRIDDIRPTSIITTAENLFNYQRKLIEDQFGCEVFDTYGGRETSAVAGECKEHTGLHISTETAIFEFVKNNEQVSPGEMGEILITDLCNYAMPFIRYEVGDAGIPSDEICPCGRGLSLIKSIEGRIHDFINAPSGRILPGEFFPAIFADYGIKGIKEYQIVQEAKDKLLVKIVKGQDYSEKELDRYMNVIQKYVGEEMDIEIKFVELIPTSKSGKRRFTISEVET